MASSFYVMSCITDTHSFTDVASNNVTAAFMLIPSELLALDKPCLKRDLQGFTRMGTRKLTVPSKPIFRNNDIKLSERRFFSSHSVQTGSGAHTSPNQTARGEGLFQRE
jgi:hypothetical protein